MHRLLAAQPDIVNRGVITGIAQPLPKFSRSLINLAYPRPLEKERLRDVWRPGRIRRALRSALAFKKKSPEIVKLTRTPLPI